jgi:hypothetical protein
MNNDVKEVLIDLIDYWNTLGTEDNPGMEALCSVVQRASKALDQHAKGTNTDKEDKKSADIDPYELLTHKLEEEW